MKRLGKVWRAKMKAWTKETVIDQYISSCTIIELAVDSGDYKKSNKERSKLVSAYKWLEKNVQEANEILKELLHNSSPVVQTKAAAHCLCLNICKEEALNVLKSVSTRSDIWGLNAEKVLEGYYKKPIKYSKTM